MLRTSRPLGERKLYNGKELDEMTGLYYYGARYYDPRDGIFLGGDPLAEKNPSITPFRYGLNNPIRFIDPDGRTEIERTASLNRAREFIAANPNGSKSLYGFAGYHKGEPGRKIDCSGLVSQSAWYSGFGYLNTGIKGHSGYNGVANIVFQSTTRHISSSDIKPGNIVTMSKRVVHNGYSLGHVALIERVDRNDKGEIIGLNLLHSKGSTGPIEQYVDFLNPNDKYAKFIETFNYWAWDSPEEGETTNGYWNTEFLEKRLNENFNSQSDLNLNLNFQKFNYDKNTYGIYNINPQSIKVDKINYTAPTENKIN